MVGIYIHIPFCRQKCYYCCFHTSTSLEFVEKMVDAEVKEIELMKDYFDEKEVIKTIYFGGGTPSILDCESVYEILNAVYKNFKVWSKAEVSFECNPEDLVDFEKVKNLKKMGINRLSLGVQSFNDKFLRMMNRANNSEDIFVALDNINNAGFDNFNLDLIFGIFGQTMKDLDSDLEKILKIRPKHVSAYCLTVEDNTVFDFWVKKGKIEKVSDDITADFFLMVDNILKDNGYEHYEISNYCLKGFESKHNMGYWVGEKYLGIGAGAHSYNCLARKVNIENNQVYIEKINKGEDVGEVEILSKRDKINEYIFTRLRTNRGIDFDVLKSFGYVVIKNL